MRNASAVVSCALLVSFLTACGSSNSEQTPPAAQATQPNQAVPTTPQFGTLSVTPASASGRQQTFTLRLLRNLGSPDPALIGFLISNGMVGSEACYVFREFIETERTLLVNDSGSGSRVLGSAASVGNKQCELISVGTTTNVAADAITLTFNLRFRTSFVGDKQIYAIAQDNVGGSAGLQQIGQFKVE